MPISLFLLQPTLLADGCLSSDSLWEIHDFRTVDDTERDRSESWKALYHVKSGRYFVIKADNDSPQLEFSLALKENIVIGSGDTRNPSGAFVIQEFP